MDETERLLNERTKERRVPSSNDTVANVESHSSFSYGSINGVLLWWLMV